MSLKKQMSFSKGIYRRCTERTSGNNQRGRTRKESDRRTTNTYGVLLLSAFALCWATGPTAPDTGTPSHPCIIFLFHSFQKTSRTWILQKQYSISCDDSTWLSDFNPNLSIKIQPTFFFSTNTSSHMRKAKTGLVPVPSSSNIKSPCKLPECARLNMNGQMFMHLHTEEKYWNKTTISIKASVIILSGCQVSCQVSNIKRFLSDTEGKACVRLHPDLLRSTAHQFLSPNNCQLHFQIQIFFKKAAWLYPGGVMQVQFRKSSIKGIFWRKFNPWSNTLWHQVRPPLKRSSFPTASLCSFSNLRNDRMITIHCSLCLHQETAIKKPLIATNNAQNSIKLQQQYK